MKFAFAFIPSMPYKQVIEIAQRAEDLGFGHIYIPDQTFHPDPFVLLGLCARATSRISLGLAVTNPFTRHPVQIARAAGLLGEISEGRFILGMGTGNRPRVLNGLGIDPAPIVDRLKEALLIIRGLLAGEVIDHHSAWVTLNEVGLDYRPPYDVPIHIASRGPRILSLAGEVADGVLMEGLFSDSALRFALRQVETGAQQAGRSFSDLQKTAWQSVTLTDDPDAASDLRLRNWAALLIRTTKPGVLREMGISTSVTSAVLEDAAAFGEAGAGQRVTAADVHKLLMVGSPAEIRSHVQRLEDRGVDNLAVIVLGDYGVVRATLERFAGEVMSPELA